MVARYTMVHMLLHMHHLKVNIVEQPTIMEVVVLAHSHSIRVVADNLIKVNMVV